MNSEDTLIFLFYLHFIGDKFKENLGKNGNSTELEKHPLETYQKITHLRQIKKKIGSYLQYELRFRTYIYIKIRKFLSS